MSVIYRAKHAKKQHETAPARHAKKKVRLPIGAYLSYLLLATVLLSGISTSKFATTHSAGGNARIAVVELAGDKVDGQSTDLSIDLSTPDAGTRVASYSFYVTNLSSEVALEYSLTVTLPQALPTGLTMTMTPDGGTAQTYLSVQNNTYLFSGSAFPAGSNEQHPYTLTFTGTEDIMQSTTLTGVKISTTALQTN